MNPIAEALRAITCKICGEQKRETNHWWLLSVAEKALPSDGLGKIPTVKQLVITEWNIIMAHFNGQHPVCGHGCAQKGVERFMTTGSIEGEKS